MYVCVCVCVCLNWDVVSASTDFYYAIPVIKKMITNFLRNKQEHKKHTTYVKQPHAKSRMHFIIAPDDANIVIEERAVSKNQKVLSFSVGVFTHVVCLFEIIKQVLPLHTLLITSFSESYGLAI